MRANGGPRRAQFAGLVQCRSAAVRVAAVGGPRAGLGGVGGQSDGDVFRGHNGGAPLAVDTLGFSKGWSCRYLCKTPRSVPAVPARGANTRSVSKLRRYRLYE